jgi:phage terminase large subunit GpA-like protein
LPKSSAEAGPWRSSRVPYTRAICKAAADPRIKRVVMVMASQSSKTECMLNILGHRLDDDPAPVIMVLPTQRLATSMSQSRLMPMIASTAGLREKLDRRKTSNKTTEKYIAGQRLGLAWAGSATELSSHPAALILIDELDRMDADVSGEGDPVSLAEARITTFPDGKLIIASTPTLEGASRIWSLYESGTMEVWTWPCPDCLNFFAPSFELLKWPEKSSPAHAKREARLMCPHCGSLLEDRHRNSMNAAGKFELQGDPESDTASYLVSGLASPWRSWGEAAKQWVEAARSREPERMQATMNTVFGELWRIQGDAPEAESVKALRGGYRCDELPAAVVRITAGVDVQKNRLVYVVRGWGAGSTSWLLRHGEIYGDTDQQSVWADLAGLMEMAWGERELRIYGMLVDSGYRPDVVYDFALRFPKRVFPSKGHQTLAKPVSPSKVELDARRNPMKRGGIELMHVNTHHFKDFVHTRIRTPLGERGAFYLPIDATDDYCEQLVSESKVVKANGKVLWVRNGANHYFDAEVLAAAAAYMANVHHIPAPRPADADAPQAPATSPPPPAPRAPPSQRAPMQRPASNWTTSWRR